MAPQIFGTVPKPFRHGTTIYTTQKKRFFSSWVRFQFLIGTPSLQLLAIICKMWLKSNQEESASVKQGNWSTSWRNEKKDGNNVLSIISRNFHFFFFCLFHSCWTCLTLVYMFVATFSFFIHQILHCVTFKISMFHLNLTYIQKASKGNLLLNNILQNTKETIHKITPWTMHWNVLLTTMFFKVI